VKATQGNNLSDGLENFRLARLEVSQLGLHSDGEAGLLDHFGGAPALVRRLFQQRAHEASEALAQLQQRRLGHQRLHATRQSRARAFLVRVDASEVRVQDLHEHQAERKEVHRDRGPKGREAARLHSANNLLGD